MQRLPEAQQYKAMTIYTHLRQKKLASIASLPDTPNATTENMNRYAAIW